MLYNLDKKKDKKENLSILLFVGITSLFVLFTLGRFEKTDSGFTLNIFYNQHIVSIAILGSLYISLIVLFFKLQKDKKNKISIPLLIFFILLAIFKITSLLTYPYGAVTYNFKEYEDFVSASFTYSGLDLEQRITSIFIEILFYSYFAFMPMLLRCLNHDKMKKTLEFFFVILLLGALFLIIYACIFQFEYIKFNLKIIFTDDNSVFSPDITSLTPHHNVFGNILMLAGFTSLYFFFTKKKIIWLLIPVFLDFCLLVIICKTGFFLLLFAMILTSLLFPILSHKQNKKYAIFFSIINFILIILIVLVLTVFRENIYDVYIKPTLDRLTYNATLISRLRLFKAGIHMWLYDIRTFLFGYSRVAFYQVFGLYNQIVKADVSVYCSHCSFSDLLAMNGVLFSLLLFGYFFFFLFKDLKKIFSKNKGEAIGILLLWCILFVYSCIEPRMLFYYDGSCMFFMGLLLYQMNEAQSITNKSILLNRLL